MQALIPRVMAWALATAALLLICAAPALAARRSARPAAQDRRACPPARIGGATCAALVRVSAHGAAPDAAPAAGGGEEPLTPAQLASAYEYEPSAGGSGQTVAIVDAYDDPSIEADLGEYDAHYKLAPCTSANHCLTKVGQTGTSKLPARDTSGWSVEISLDVESVHAVCPKCKILLVEADSEGFKDLAAAEDTAVSLGATVVSNSYAGPEEGMGPAEQEAYDHPGVVIAAATGDDGYYDWDLYNEGASSSEIPPEPGAPASLPSVVAVGGTSLVLEPDGARASETVWNNNGPRDLAGLAAELPEGATGSGCSTIFTAPLWQQHAPGFAASGCATKRLSADVAADADPNTGVYVYDSYDCGSSCEEFGIGRGTDWITVGGTSLATPLISGMWALAGGAGGVSDPALTLYGHLAQGSDIYDVTEGGSGYCDGEKPAACGSPPSSFGTVDCAGSTACDAAVGLDGPSGVGTPKGLGLFRAISPHAAITSPGAQLAGALAAFSAGNSTDPYPGGSIVSYRWNWGDSSAQATGVSASHRYATPGDYTVTLSVEDSYGLTGTATQTISVLADAEEVAAARKAEAEAEAVKRSEEEAAAKKREEEEAAAKKSREEAAAARKHEEELEQARREEEEALARGEQEEAARRRAEEEAASKLAEEEASAPKRSGGQTIQGALSAREAALQTPVFSPVPAPAGPAGGVAVLPVARVLNASLRASASGAVRVRISCPSGESMCLGTITLRTLRAVSAGSSAHRRVLTLARGGFAMAGGSVASLTLHLGAEARGLLAQGRLTRVRALLVAHDPAGARHAGTQILAFAGLVRPAPRRR